MQEISYEWVEQCYEQFGTEQAELEIEGLIEQFSAEQPILFTYLMTMGEDDFDAPEQELLLFMGLLIWQSMITGGNELGPITEDHLESVQGNNMAMLEYLTEEGEEGFGEMAKHLMEESDQPHLLRFLVEIVFEDEGDIIRPTNQGILFIFLKIVVDSISASLND